MSPSQTVALGFIAACVTTGAWVPQAWKCVRTRSARDFSWPSLGGLSVGIALWLAYGIVRADAAIIGANAITLMLVLTITMVKLRYG